MAKLSRGRAGHLIRGTGDEPRRPQALVYRAAVRGLALSLLLVWLVAPGASAQAPVIDLVGTWYVLIHYKDDHAKHPERERWLDKIWRFDEVDGGLHWTEYAIVVFDDETGRFERLRSGQHARVLQYWEPSAAQKVEIRNGLQVNDRGSKRKTLRGSAAEGWLTATRSRPASSSSLTYTEHWSISGLMDKPLFTRRDVLGSGRSDSLEGTTTYLTSVIEPEGDRLRGKYVRDGFRHGWFRMQRTVGTRPLEGSDSQLDRLLKHVSGDEVAPGGGALPSEPDSSDP